MDNERRHSTAFSDHLPAPGRLRDRKILVVKAKLQRIIPDAVNCIAMNDL
jgi:hypothetical protein